MPKGFLDNQLREWRKTDKGRRFMLALYPLSLGEEQDVEPASTLAGIGANT